MPISNDLELLKVKLGAAEARARVFTLLDLRHRLLSATILQEKQKKIEKELNNRQ